MEITYRHKLPAKGENNREINVEVDGEPFGQLYTFSAQHEQHPWHAKLLNGEYAQFWTKDGGLVAAIKWVERQAAKRSPI